MLDALEIGYAIKDARSKLGMTQAQLAETADSVVHEKRPESIPASFEKHDGFDVLSILTGGQNGDA